MEKLSEKHLAVAAAAATGVTYIVCVAVVAAAPDIAVQLVSKVFHVVSVEQLLGNIQLTPAGFVSGLVQVMVYAALFGFGVAWLYNKILPKK